MDSNQRKHISKFLSLVLRHKPEAAGLVLDEHGWTNTHELLSKLKFKNIDITFVDLKEVVALNDKQRLVFSEDMQKIRANQGHSVLVDLELQPVVPPEVLYHGTAEKNLESITEKGIVKRTRNHVHLSEDVITATSVGSRYGKPVVLKVKALAMHNAGYIFYLSENKVWLVDYVPADFIML
jgi:putative RNA 2'-phosphotransferase